MCFSLADQVADRRGRNENLTGDDAAPAVEGRQQLLGDDSLQGDRELRADLALLRRREDVDDPIDGLRRRLGVKSGEDQVACLGRGQGGGDRLQVAHLADQDHVRVLAQGGAQAEGEVGGIGADLALVDNRAFVVVKELDRVLDREDVVRRSELITSIIAARVVDLPRAGRPGDEDEAARFRGQLPQDLRDPQGVEAGDLLRDQAKGRR